MIVKLVKYLFIALVLNIFLFASEAIPAKDEVAKLYVATFNRAPDSAGLNYWVNDSGLTLSQIAQSFFDQSETQALYPPTTSNRDFIKSVYQNLFNRDPDADGWDYWENQLNIGAFSKNRFIEAVINGALGDDAVILSNKTEVGLYFSSKGLNDTKDAKSVIKGVTSKNQSVYDTKNQIDTLSNQNISSWSAADTLSHANIVKTIDINGNLCTITQDSIGIHYVCEDNLSSSKSFDYDTIASAIASNIPHTANTKDIIVAESNIANEAFTFFAPPIIYKGKMYGSWGGRHMVNEAGYGDSTDSSEHTLLKINEYDLSKFDHDMDLESLVSKTIYSSDAETLWMFQSSPTNLMEINGYLYFTTPAKRDFSSLDDLSKGKYYEILKYSLLKNELIYDKIGLPAFDYNSAICPTADGMTNYVDITYGWMVPSSGTKIAFLHGERETQVDMCSGKDVMVRADSPDQIHKNCAYSTLVKQKETEYTNPFTISVSDSDNYYALNGDTITKTSFNRQGKTSRGVSYVDKRVNVFDDFKTLDASSAQYIHLELLGSPIIDINKNKIYTLALLTKNAQEYKATADLYILEYDTSLKLISANKVVQGENKWDVYKDDGIYAFSNTDPHLYKYQDKLFFIYADQISMPKLYAYNLNNHSLDYTYNMYEDNPGYQDAINSATTDEQKNMIASIIPKYTTHYRPMSNNPLEGYDYAITGANIIIPQNIGYGNDDKSYEIVFDVIDVATGKKIKTISHNLIIDNWSNYKIAIQNSYVYANSVYFIMKKQYEGQGNHYTRNMLIKINSPKNTTQVTRYRGDNRLTGVIRNFEVESGFKPKTDKQNLIYQIYNFLNNSESSMDDLKIALLNTITKEKGLSSTADLFASQNNTKEIMQYTPTYSDVTTTADINYSQETPLYNTELGIDTQNFYIPLLTKVTYSSSNDGDGLGEARLKINAQYGCTKSYFKFPANGSVKILGFNPVDDSYEFQDNNNMPEALSFYPKVPMLVVDYNSMLENQTLLRYGIDAIEHDSLDKIEWVTESIKSNLDSLISTGISIVSGNYVSAVCSTTNIITSMAVDNLQTGDTYYGSAMKIYTASSNFGIDDNRSFSADKIEGSAKSYSIDADSAGDIVEGICSGASVDPVAIYSFATKSDVSEKHISAEVVPTWHKGISISHLKVEVVDTQFLYQPITPINAFHQAHVFDVKGYVGTLGTQDIVPTVYEYHPYEPFRQKVKVSIPFTSKADPFDGWDYKNRILFDKDYVVEGLQTSSMAGVYIELVFYSDNVQMGVFSDTLFLDEAIYTDRFIKNGNNYSTTVTKSFYLPDGSLDFKRKISGNITYKVTFSVDD